jgi:hypothetical protein
MRVVDADVGEHAKKAVVLQRSARAVASRQRTST